MMTQSSAFLFFRIGLLYAGIGIVLGFAQGGVAPLLVARGMPIEQAGFAMLLFAPFGLSFLWAPLIERHEAFGQRFGGWILAMQFVATVLLAAIAFLEAAPLPLLFVLGFAATSALATMDIRLEALVVCNVPESRRPVAGAIKIGTFTLGAFLGGGVLIAFFNTLGWQNTMLILAFVLVCGLAAATKLPRSTGAGRGGFRAAWRQKGFPAHLAAISFLFASFFMLFGMARIALIDLGYGLEDVGLLVGTTSPLLSLPIIPLIGLAATRFGRAPVLVCLRGLAVLTGLLWVLAALQGWLWLAVIACLSGAMVLSGIYVFALSALLTWSEGDHPATSYALLYGGGNMAVMIPMAGAGFLAATVGWAGYYLVATVIFIVTSENFSRRTAHHGALR